MRRLVIGAAVILGSLVLTVSPAGAQDELEPPSAEDAAAIAAIGALDDGYVCPDVVGATAREYEEFQLSSGYNGVEVALDRFRMLCRYAIPSVGNADVKLEFSRVGIRPEICDVESLPYEATTQRSRVVILGQVLPPLAINAEFSVRPDVEVSTVDGLRAAARSMADLVAPMAETCPTPLDIDISPVDETAATQLAILDLAAAAACQQLEIPPDVELERSGALRGASVSFDGISVIEGQPTRVPQTNPRISCSFDGASYEIRVDPVPAVTESGFSNGLPFPDRQNGCDGIDQYAPPAALVLTVATDEVLRPFVEAQARTVADLLLALAVNCELELEQYNTTVIDTEQTRPSEAVTVICPSIEGFDPSPFNELVGEPGPAAADLSGGIPRTFPGIDGTCSWEAPGDGELNSAPSIRLQLFILQDWRTAEEAERLCSAEERPVSETTFGRVVAGDSAAMVDIVVLEPRSGDIGRAERAAAEWLDVGSAMARSCADVEIIPLDSLFEPLPQYLSGAVEAGLAGSFAVAPAVDPTDDTSSEDPDDGQATTGATSSTPQQTAGGDSGGVIPTLLRIARVLMLVVSLAGLAMALLLVRRPSRIRPAMEYMRVVFALGGAVVMMSVFSAGAPIWAVAVALAGGAGLGLLQGHNLTIMASTKGLMAKRSALAILAFAAGLLATQVAGLLNRTGVISIGLALSFLSAAMAAGLIAGRRPALIDARSAAGLGAVLLIAGLLIAPVAVRPSSAQDSAEDEIVNPVDVLNAGVAWDEISLIGGVAGDSKPELLISLDPSFAVAPESVTRDIAVDTYLSGSFQQITGTETYSFELVEGVCCELLYSATGSLSRLYLDGWSDPAAPLLVEEGSLGVIGPVRSFSGIRFEGSSQARDGSCRRTIADTRTDVEQSSDLVATVGGLERNRLFGQTNIWAPCELDVSLADAAEVTGPPPSGDSPDREDGGRQCPVVQEVIDTLAFATTFDASTTSNLTRRFVDPNRPACWDSGLEFGEEGRGGIRSELTYYLSRPDPFEAIEFDRDGYDYINGGPRNADLDLVCEEGPDGLPLPSPVGDCARVGFHQVVTPSGGGQFYIFTDYDSSDGPNVIVRGVFPSGIFRYRCHHCQPGDPEVASMVQSITALVSQGSSGGNLGTVIGSRGGPLATAVALGGSSAAGDSGRSANEDAAMAGLIGLIAAMGITAATLAESGLSTGDLLTSWNSGGASAVRATLSGAGVDSGVESSPPDTAARPPPVIDEFGNPISPNADDLYEWDTPDGTELLEREEIEARIAAEREASASRDVRHSGIVDDQTSDDAAAQRFDDLGARSIADNDADMEEIRSGWDRVDELGAQLEERERILSGLTAAEAEQDLATLRDTWGQIFSETAQASWSDATEIPGILGEASLEVLRAATTAENWTILAEGAAETAYDVAGLLAGNSFGDAQESIQQGAVATGRVAVALGDQFVRHPIDTAAMFIPGRDFADALDGERTLGQRLGSVGMGVLDIGATLAGAGILGHVDELADAARAMDLAEEATGAARVLEAGGDAADAARVVEASEDAASAARVLEAAGDVPGQMTETVRLTEAAQEAREAARAAMASGNSAEVARALDAAAEADRAAEAARRSLFRDGGMQGMGRAEAAGGVSDELAQSVVNVHDEITGAATRQGVVDAVDDFATEVGFRPNEVMMGNSGSVGAGRSVLTDADRTIVASFSRDQLTSARRAGESLADTQRRLQGRLTQLHQRSAELAMNSPTDPAVILARRDGISLSEAVAVLGDADDPAAASIRLTAGDVDMQSYNGFGAGAGQSDAYPSGYTLSRQSTQGRTEVFTFGDEAGDARTYTTSGQAIIDRNELNRMDLASWDDVPGSADTGRGLDSAESLTRIGNAEMTGLLREQQAAIGRYSDVKSVSKAVDRAHYVAGRIGQPLPNPALTNAARTIRANPRATQAVLRQMGMSESEFVSSLQEMMSTYNPVLPT